MRRLQGRPLRRGGLPERHFTDDECPEPLAHQRRTIHYAGQCARLRDQPLQLDIRLGRRLRLPLEADAPACEIDAGDAPADGLPATRLAMAGTQLVSPPFRQSVGPLGQRETKMAFDLRETRLPFGVSKVGQEIRQGLVARQ